MNKKDKENIQFDEINAILDKMLDMKKSEKKPKFCKTMYIDNGMHCHNPCDYYSMYNAL